MVSLHGFSILILLTQSIHKSALLFSCTSPFSGAYGYYTIFFLKSQTYVCIISRKTRKIFQVIHNAKGESRAKNKNRRATFQRKPARREEKGDPQAGQRGRLFAAGLSVAACFIVPPVWYSGFIVRLSGCISVDFRRELVCGGA